MGSKEAHSKLFFPIIRRYLSSNEQTPRVSVRSFFIRFIDDRRKKIQRDDIRLEPYISTGVYTESGAIRPVSFSEQFYSLIFFVNYLDAETISTWYYKSFSYCNSISLSWFSYEQICSIRS